MDSISSLFRVNMITTCSDAVKASCDINSILRNYDLIDNLTRITFRDLSSNTAHPITQLKLRINSIEDSKRRPEVSLMQQELQDVVLEESNRYQLSDIVDLEETPWFERWKDKFISMHINYEHDFIGANFGVFIVLSQKDLQTFDSIAAKLLTQVRDNTLLRFMTTNFIEHYIIVNTQDSNFNSTNQNEELLESDVIPPDYQPGFTNFVNCFGQRNCSWLNVPQNNPSLNIEQFLKNFINVSLVPWCERQVRILNAAISTRKGIRRNLVLVTRQLLSMGHNSYVNQSVVYTSDSGEMQCRKLGDIAMCLGLHQLASSSYDQAKKEFLNDGAWLYYAGACEAYAAAMFMQGKFQRSYIGKAVATYMDPCKSLALATRATILATDLLKNQAPKEAASFFITLTVNESDLLCGLFLEQASRCFALGRSMRKSAFHYVLAGYRYGKCGLKKLSVKCYAQFTATEWVAAIEYVKLSTKHAMERASDDTKAGDASN